MKNTKQAIEQTRGKFFSASFIKKDGSERKMLARTGVKKYLRGGENTHKNHSNLVTVWDCQKKNYRSINLETVFDFKCGNIKG